MRFMVRPFPGWPTVGHERLKRRDAVKLWDLIAHRELLSLPAEGKYFFDLAFFARRKHTGRHVPRWHRSSLARALVGEIEVAEKRSMAP